MGGYRLLWMGGTRVSVDEGAGGSVEGGQGALQTSGGQGEQGSLQMGGQGSLHICPSQANLLLCHRHTGAAPSLCCGKGLPWPPAPRGPSCPAGSQANRLWQRGHHARSSAAGTSPRQPGICKLS